MRLRRKSKVIVEFPWRRRGAEECESKGGQGFVCLQRYTPAGREGSYSTHPKAEFTPQQQGTGAVLSHAFKEGVISVGRLNLCFKGLKVEG